MKPISAALTTKELDCLDSISSLFQKQSVAPSILTNKENEEEIKLHKVEDKDDLTCVIENAR